jgi:hypothetical protein
MVKLEFFQAFFCIPDETVRRYEFSIYHVGSEMLADEPERRISNVLHRRQEQGLITQGYIANLYQFAAFQFDGQS